MKRAVQDVAVELTSIGGRRILSTPSNCPACTEEVAAMTSHRVCGTALAGLLLLAGAAFTQATAAPADCNQPEVPNAQDFRTAQDADHNGDPVRALELYRKVVNEAESSIGKVASGTQAGPRCGRYSVGSEGNLRETRGINCAAREAIGEHYELGLGTGKDLATAVYWYKLALTDDNVCEPSIRARSRLTYLQTHRGHSPEEEENRLAAERAAAQEADQNERMQSGQFVVVEESTAAAEKVSLDARLDQDHAFAQRFSSMSAPNASNGHGVPKANEVKDAVLDYWAGYIHQQDSTEIHQNLEAIAGYLGEMRDSLKDRNAQDAAETRARDRASIEQLHERDQAIFHADATARVHEAAKSIELTVDQKQPPKNFEGNVIAFVLKRQHGSDETVRLKVTLQQVGGRWIVVNYIDPVFEAAKVRQQQEAQAEAARNAAMPLAQRRSSGTGSMNFGCFTAVMTNSPGFAALSCF